MKSSKSIATPWTNAQNLGIFDATHQDFWSHWMQERPAYCRQDEWNSEADIKTFFGSLPAGGILTSWQGTQQVWVGMWDEVLVKISNYGSYVWNITGFHDERKKVDELFDRFYTLLPRTQNVDHNVIPIAFWSLDSMGNPSSIIRKIESHYWHNISSNYPSSVRRELTALMKVAKPDDSGKLVLWHGEPGVGKTNCIRALAHAWREWADVDYVVDPEQLFGRANYMMNCLVNGRNDEDRWRLIVLEDSGEFLRKDAGSRSGHGFGRLLNITDGLVGKGLKLIILITTNEPFGELHPAVARPGRCLAHLEFPAFPADEAGQWLGIPVNEDKTLADLYEMKAERQGQIKKERESYRPGVYV